MIISSLLYTKICHSASIRENCAEIFYFRSRRAGNKKAPRPRKAPARARRTAHPQGRAKRKRPAMRRNAHPQGRAKRKRPAYAWRNAHPQGRAKRKRPAVRRGGMSPDLFIAFLPSFYARRRASAGGKLQRIAPASIRRAGNRRGRALLRSCGRRSRSLPPLPARARCTRCRRCRRSSPPPCRR